MAIEITEFAQVNISVSPTGVGLGNFGILGFLALASDAATNPITSGERARGYTSLSAVAGDWPATSETYAAALAFYGQTPTPTDFKVLMSYDVAQSASLVGGNFGTLAEMNAISSGVMDIDIDGTVINLSGVDLSAAGDFAAVASAVEALLDAEVAGATCDFTDYGFTVKSPLSGAASTITAAYGDVADVMGLSFAGTKSDGIDVETPAESLAAISALAIDYVGLVTDKSIRDDVVQVPLIASFCEADKKIFMNTTNDLSTLSSGTSSDIASALKASSYRYTLTTFSRNIDQYPSASVFGRAASVNFAGVSSTITLNLKQMPGVTSENLTPSEFAALRSKYASAVVQIGTSVNAYTDSRMASGSWLDTTHGLMWLENRCEVDMFNLLYTTNTKIPYTQTGINTAAATLEKSLSAAVRNGLAGAGFLPDGTYLPEGYVVEAVSLADTSPSDKSNRIYKGLSFKMVGAGALHEVVISGEFSE